MTQYCYYNSSCRFREALEEIIVGFLKNSKSPYIQATSFWSAWTLGMFDSNHANYNEISLALKNLGNSNDANLISVISWIRKKT